MLNNYRLKDGSLYWHKLYFDLVPEWMKNYAPPFGDYNYASYLYQPHKYIIALYDKVKWFIQRGCRGWAECDAWGWCTHLSKMNVQVLTYIRDNAHGYPVGLTPAKWDKKLKVMIEGFQAMQDEDDDVTSYKTLSRSEHRKLVFSRQRKLMLGLKYFREYYYNLWD